MSAILFHNPRCSKSREALRLLEESNFAFDVHLYLKEGVSVAAVEKLCSALGEKTPWAFIRKKEAVCKELGLSVETGRTKLIQAISDNPILLERPILLHGKKAVVGRPPELVLELV